MSSAQVTKANGIVLGTVEITPVAGSKRGKWAVSWIGEDGEIGSVALPAAAAGPLIRMLAPLAPDLHVVPCDNYAPKESGA